MNEQLFYEENGKELKIKKSVVIEFFVMFYQLSFLVALTSAFLGFAVFLVYQVIYLILNLFGANLPNLGAEWIAIFGVGSFYIGIFIVSFFIDENEGDKLSFGNRCVKFISSIVFLNIFSISIYGAYETIKYVLNLII
jgi:hypothetical protein